MRRMLELTEVSRSSFYRHQADGVPRPDPDLDRRDAIQRIALEMPSCGRPRITAELRRRGWMERPLRGGLVFLPVKDFPSNGQQCLNWLSCVRGQA